MNLIKTETGTNNINKYIPEAYKCDFKVIAKEVETLNLSELLAYLEEIKTRKAPNTYNKRCYAIKALIQKLIDSNLNLTQSEKLKYMDIKKSIKPIKINQYLEVHTLSELQINTLINGLDDKFAVLIEFLYITGCRISEAINLTTTNVKTNGKVIYTVIGKGNKTRQVKTNMALYKNILRFSQPDGKLFPDITANNAKTKLKRHSAKILKNNGITPHTLRHSRATHLIQSTKNISAVSKYLGHSDIGTTAKIYDHNRLSDDELGIW